MPQLKTTGVEGCNPSATTEWHIQNTDAFVLCPNIGDFDRRSRETQIIKGYKLGPFKLGCTRQKSKTCYLYKLDPAAKSAQSPVVYALTLSNGTQKTWGTVRTYYVIANKSFCKRKWANVSDQPLSFRRVTESVNHFFLVNKIVLDE